MSHPEQSPRKTVRFIHANPTTVTIPPPPTSDSASSISSSVASESSTQPLLSSAETHRRQSQRPTSSAKPRSRSPSPSTAHVTTTTNSKETSPPNHRRLMHFLLHQKKYARDPQTGESSQSAQGNGAGSSEKDRENGLKKSKRVFIPPPPLPQQYGTVSGSECGLGPCRIFGPVSCRCFIFLLLSELGQPFEGLV
ncbi:hypothetical protein Ddc_11203 [Ditylenchus destructor]|nr:hypothetical protein Ddc_11203 [Ditylenchus destructor]